MDDLELLVNEAFDGGSISEVIRPAAVLREWETRAVLVELSLRDVRRQGRWHATAVLWERYDRPWTEPAGPGQARLLGAIQVAYGTPTTYEITLYRATVTPAGTAVGWTVRRLCDEALGYVGLDLDRCPRVDLRPPPEPFVQP